ncbi:amidohydrolase/deacetylase family metallohydrolase [Bacillus massiliglaciei]|uniref:amidohydrolase/deacetylase family metallohydrolase n=1 Tax=Bacillus massiliglaciei TaxID=1816693 RepID=UPI0018FEDB57|nr:amidohydrolase/deacetylase family metallohydrolase [Bacillus massiliglaciei]
MREATILKNGWVFDSEAETFVQKDVYIAGGTLVSAEKADLDSVIEIDLKGSYVAPGFIDMHVHVFETKTTLGINADKVGIDQGVTTIVDAGSSGIEDFKDFKQTVAQKSLTEVLSFLNISKKGLCEGLSELSDMDDLMTVQELTEILAAEKNIVGLKARMSASVVKDNGIKPLEHTRKLADETKLPIMVHIGNAPPDITEVLPLLKKGDMVTHAFHGKKGGILNEEGKLISEAHEAISRGVLFDVGHGTSSFSYRTMRMYKEKYPYPFSTSTDIYMGNYHEPVGSLMTTMSKLLAIGYSLEELVASVTSRPKRALKLVEQGSLEPGTRADITVFKVEEQHETLVDSQGEILEVDRMIVPQLTIREGKVVYEAHEY